LEMTRGLPGSSPAKYDYRIELVNQRIPHISVTREFTSDFEVGECWGYNRFFRIDNLVKDGYLVPDDDVIVLRFYVRPQTYYQYCRDLKGYVDHLEASRLQDTMLISDLRRKLDNGGVSHSDTDQPPTTKMHELSTDEEHNSNDIGQEDNPEPLQIPPPPPPPKNNKDKSISIISSSPSSPAISSDIPSSVLSSSDSAVLIPRPKIRLHHQDKPEWWEVGQRPYRQTASSSSSSSSSISIHEWEPDSPGEIQNGDHEVQDSHYDIDGDCDGDVDDDADAAALFDSLTLANYEVPSLPEVVYPASSFHPVWALDEQDEPGDDGREGEEEEEEVMNNEDESS